MKNCVRLLPKSVVKVLALRSFPLSITHLRGQNITGPVAITTRKANEYLWVIARGSGVYYMSRYGIKFLFDFHGRWDINNIAIELVKVLDISGKGIDGII